jgi:hypothetical protein
VSFQLAPVFRVETTLTHLHRAREYRPATSAAELFADALLAGIKTAVRGTKGLTGADLAAVVEAAEQAAKLAAENTVCGCGHLWAEHVGRAGCLEAECACRERRPAREVSWTPRVLPTAAQVARAYEDDDRHFPHAGAR